MDKEDKKEIVGMFEHISEKVDKGFSDVRSEISGVRSEVKDFRSEISDVHSEMKDFRSEISDVRSEMKDFRSEISDVRSEMKDFRNETSENFQEIRNDIKGLRIDLNLVEEKTENNTGFSKEIDILFDEVKNIKEHIGLKESC